MSPFTLLAGTLAVGATAMRRTRNWIMVYSRKPPIGLLSNREPSLRKGFPIKPLLRQVRLDPKNIRIQPY
ncbi:hypothetical protein [Profundibacter sp.]